MTRWRAIRIPLLVALLLSSISCSVDDLTGVPSAPPAALQAGPLRLLTGLLACTPQRYAISWQVIGPAGGTISVGRHSLTIPRGALTRPVFITAEAPSDTVSSVRLYPEGLTFAAGAPARLTLDYSNCPLGRLQVGKHIAYTTNALDIISLLLSADNILLARVSAPLEHFSRYAVAW